MKLDDFCVIYINEISPRYNLTATRRASKLSLALSSILYSSEIYLLGSTSTEYDHFSSDSQMEQLRLHNVHVIEIPAVEFYTQKRIHPYTHVNSTKPEVKQQQHSRSRSLLKPVWNIFGPIIKIFCPMLRWNIYHNTRMYKYALSNILDDPKNKNKNTLVFCSVTTFQFFTLWLGKWLKKKYGQRVTIIADLRDPIYNNPHAGWLGKNKLISALVSRALLRNFDFVITVGKLITEDLVQRVGISADKVFTIPTGYTNSEIEVKLFDVESVKKSSWLNNDGKSVKIVYTGSLEKRNKEFLWFVTELEKVANQIQKFEYEIYYAGKDVEVFENILNKIECKRIKACIMGYVGPEELQELHKRADVLLLISDVDFNGRAVTGKIFEYLLSFKPILAVAPRGSEVEEYLDDSISKVLIYRDEDGAEIIKDFILKLTNLNDAEFQTFISRRMRIVEKLKLEEKLSLVLVKAKGKNLRKEPSV